MWRLDSDWYSPIPTRLCHTPTEYDFPGDRFIPNRSLMDLDQAHSLLTNKTKQICNSNFNELYRQKVAQSLTLDSEGRPFRMMVFRGSPKSSRKSIRLIDEMLRDESEAINNPNTQYQFRRMPKAPASILDAPSIKNDYYLNIMDWGKNNVLAVALGSDFYLWNADTRNVQNLFHVDDENDYPTSVVWSEDAGMVAVGFMSSDIQLWDPETSKLVRSLEGHTKRIGTMTWNGRILASGSEDKSIITHDVRAKNSSTVCIQAHAGGVCGLKWSNTGKILASGGNDNLVYIWEASKMSTSNFLYQFDEHCAAVKALAWCPYQSNVLASGGGTKDGFVKIWNIQKGTLIHSIDTKAQVCGLEWNRHHKEILSGHGFSMNHHSNRLYLWKYPSMTKVGELEAHNKSRILQLSQSPDGLTVASAGADETLRFWNIFGPPRTDNSKVSDLDGLLSLKTSLIR